MARPKEYCSVRVVRNLLGISALDASNMSFEERKKLVDEYYDKNTIVDVPQEKALHPSVKARNHSSVPARISKEKMELCEKKLVEEAQELYTELGNEYDFEKKYEERKRMLQCYAINFAEKFLKGDLKGIRISKSRLQGILSVSGYSSLLNNKSKIQLEETISKTIKATIES